MILELTFIAGQQELDLLILFLKSCIEILNLFHHSIFNKASQFPDISKSIFSLSNDIVSSSASFVFILTMSIS